MSRYENYSIKNNVHGSLYAPISSLATTIQLKDGEGARFSIDMLATLESVDTTGKVTKREIVLITGISGDVLTVTRKYAPCPASDDGNTQGQVSFSFDADDTINAYITKEHFDKIDNSINDIYENGVDKLRTDVVSGLEISVSAGPALVGSAYYDFAGDTITLTNNATNYVEISENGILVANTTGWNDKNAKIAVVITSGGAVTSIKDWRLGTVGGEISKVNIHDLTEKSNLAANDEFIVSDSDNIYNNKKIKVKNMFGHKEMICGENISKGDIVAVDNYLISKHYNLSTNGTTTGVAINNNEKYAQMVYGSGELSNKLSFVGKLTSTSTTLNIRIETDNDGEPSGILANANATHNLLTSEATTTENIINIEFDDVFSLTKGQKYRVVFDGGNGSNFTISYELHNHLQCKYGTNDYTDFLDSDSYTPTLTNGSGGENYTNGSYNFSIVPTSNFMLYSFYTDYNLSSLQITKDGETIYTGGSGTKYSPNISMEIGHTYRFSIATSGRYYFYAPRNSRSPSYEGTYPFTISGVGGVNGNDNYPLYLGYLGYSSDNKTLLIESALLSSYINKTDKRYTYKILGVADDDYIAGQYGGFTVAGFNCTFENENFVPGSRYIYNGTQLVKADGTHFDGNNIYVGLAIDSKTLLLELEQVYSNTSANVLAIAKNGIAMVKNGGFNRNGSGFSQSGRLVIVYDGDNMNIQETEILLK